MIFAPVALWKGRGLRLHDRLLPRKVPQLSLAQDVIDWTEIHVLDVQPLTAWQRWWFEQLFTED